MTFVLYLATDESIRSKGYGSKMLKWIVENARRTVVLNIETVEKAYENYEQRLKRQKFYIKNGFIIQN
jgi:GNAT superfamily N-acetyltransferase